LLQVTLPAALSPLGFSNFSKRSDRVKYHFDFLWDYACGYLSIF